MKRTIILLYGILALSFMQENTLAQTNFQGLPRDTALQVPLSSWKKIQRGTDKLLANKAFQMTYIGVPLIAAGLIFREEDDHFQYLRDTYIPKFRSHYDDYLQYAPGVALLGLKAAGVQGRSSWLRMLVSDAFAASIMGATVNTIKHTVNSPRPDGSNNNSFPSGHTATAFMLATMLHKEYGVTQSPWYSVGGYTVATATAVSRMINNKHWFSDVLVGAGIGILSTELGYYLADLIFKDKGLTHNLIDFNSFDFSGNPSFFGLYMGSSLMPTQFNISPGITLKASPGSTSGFEGAWFMNRYLGIGGRFTLISMPLSIIEPSDNSVLQGPNLQVQGLKSDPLNIGGIYVGPYFSYPLTNRFLVGSKLLVGYNLTRSNTISTLLKDTQTGLVSEKELMEVKQASSIGYCTNASFTIILKQNLSVRAFFDYNLIPSRFVTFVPDKNGKTDRYERHQTLQPMTLGASVNVMLW